MFFSPVFDKGVGWGAPKSNRSSALKKRRNCLRSDALLKTKVTHKPLGSLFVTSTQKLANDLSGFAVKGRYLRLIRIIVPDGQVVAVSI